MLFRSKSRICCLRAKVNTVQLLKTLRMHSISMISKAAYSIVMKQLAVGYKVVCKENGQEAIDYVASAISDNQTLSGMLFDLTVPGAMGGKEAIAQIRKMGVHIPAFVASGYADDESGRIRFHCKYLQTLFAVRSHRNAGQAHEKTGIIRDNFLFLLNQDV